MIHPKRQTNHGRVTGRGRRRRGRRLRFEPLESRALLTVSVFEVNTFDDTVDIDPGDGKAADADGYTSLRAAVMEANVLGGEHTILLKEGTYPLSIVGSDSPDGAHQTDLDIFADITVIGAGAENTTIDAQGLFRIFQVHSNARLSLQRVTLTGGNVEGESDGGLFGGAVLTGGFLSVADSVLLDNFATNGGGAIFVSGLSASALIERTTFADNRSGDGGALSSRSGSITVVDSLFQGNSAADAGGAVSSMFAQYSITNSTFSGNYVGSDADSPSGTGGAIHNDGTMTLMHVTIADNRAGSGGGLHTTLPPEGGRPGGTTQMTNSLIALNVASSPDVADVSGAIGSGGGNLIGIFDGGSVHPTDLVGSVASPLDPLLGPLADNGGPTSTRALLRGSPAIDAAVAADVNQDQRGQPRPVGEAADIGAYEVQPGDPGFNSPPVAVDDFFTLWAGEELTVDEESGVLANDSDPEDDPLTAVLFEGPQYGSLQLAADGSFSYVPAIGFAGTDSFTYQASDGLLLSNLATVTLLVQARDDGIEIDIQPGDEDNKIDLAEPWVTVAILGSDTLDVTQIDVDSLRFGATGTENSIERGGKGGGRK